jgi:hypothetical protein
MRTRFRYLTRISDVVPVRRAVSLATFSLCFTTYLSLRRLSCIEKKKDTVSSTAPPVNLDLTQWFPLDIPTVILEVWLFNPSVGNFAGHLEGNIVTAQCVEKSDVLFQRSPIWPEDVRN